MVLKSALSGSHIQASGFAGGAMTKGVHPRKEEVLAHFLVVPED